MTSPLVDLRAITLTLASKAGPVHILRGLNFHVNPQETVGIVGPSGSGKTSLLMVLAGLEAATTGEVHVAGVNLAGKSEDQLAAFRRDHVGIIFQSFHLIPTMTALENVAIPLEFRGDAKAMAHAKERLQQVGLRHRLEHYPGQLSGGEQQRVAIARALATDCKIFLADEPTGNLDQDTGNHIMDLLFSLKQQQGASLVLITHDRAIAQACNRVVEMRDGLITAEQAL